MSILGNTNQIQNACSALNITEITAMNRLQDHGIISDLAVLSRDVAEADQGKAAKWLWGNRE